VWIDLSQIICVFQGDALSDSVIRHNLSLHHNVLSVSPDDLVELKLVRPAHLSKPLPRADVMLNAASNLILASYRNQLSHVFIRVAIVALAVNGCTSQETITISGFSFGKNPIYRNVAFVFIFVYLEPMCSLSSLPGIWSNWVVICFNYLEI